MNETVQMNAIRFGSPFRVATSLVQEKNNLSVQEGAIGGGARASHVSNVLTTRFQGGTLSFDAPSSRSLLELIMHYTAAAVGFSTIDESRAWHAQVCVMQGRR